MDNDSIKAYAALMVSSATCVIGRLRGAAMDIDVCTAVDIIRQASIYQCLDGFSGMAAVEDGRLPPCSARRDRPCLAIPSLPQLMTDG